MENHYIAILVPESTGGWTVLFPDLPGCAAHSETIHLAQWMATEAAELHLETLRFDGRELPLARNLEAIRADEAWITRCQVDWTKAVVIMIRPRRQSDGRAMRVESDTHAH
jgi:predicted RNase H-like HicB family nuclease